MKTMKMTLGWLVMAAALTFCACSSEDNLAEEPKAMEQPTQATVIRVTVGAGISDGEGATRSTVTETPYEDENGKTKTRRTLQFTTGDRLYVVRELPGEPKKRLAGELTMKGSPAADGLSATFEGELKVYDGEGTATGYDFEGGDPLAESVATLLHEDMTAGLVTQNADRSLAYHPEVLAAAADVATLMTSGLLVQGGYTEGTGYSLSTGSTAQPILNCTIAGLEAGVNYKVDYIFGATAAMDGGTKTLAASMTATGGTLAFAFIAETGDKFHGIRLTNTAEATDTYDATIGRKAFESKVYNAARTAIGKKTPLTMEALEDGSIVVKNPKEGMQYRLNGGDKMAVTSEAIPVNAGDKVQFYGNGTSITKYNGTKIKDGTATVKVYGNIMSLVDEVGFATATTLTETVALGGLFYQNDKLTDASGLLLPATTLTSQCYMQMFYECTSLTAAPAMLPAKTLASYCYTAMFSGCSSLTAAPALDAETLANYCCYQMFYGCTSLTAAPALDAETLASHCYYEMFSGCSSLTAAPALPAETLAIYCYQQMFYNCTSLTAAPALRATTLANYCCYQMFLGCSSLTSVPAKLPAKTLANYCYYQMFSGCSSLTTAPELPAKTLNNDFCYYQMFKDCSSLSAVKCLATNRSTTNKCTTDWLSGVAATGTFTKASTMTSWPSSASGIPSGWTVVNAQ